MSDISAIRQEYTQKTLSENDVVTDAIAQFRTWWEETLSSEIAEPNAMAVSTVDDEGAPSSRIVLLKDFTDEGFIFYTNYNSHKGHDIVQHPNVSLLFFWKELERQVRIEGMAEKVSAAESDAYFASRPRGSQLGAWCSPQSKVIASRSILEDNLKARETEFEGRDIPRPEGWGGYIVHPTVIEFWQGRRSRLHDRIRYSRENNAWKVERLAP